MPCGLLLCLMVAGCLDPQVSDEVKVQRHILPPGAEAPIFLVDQVLAGQIDRNDGVDGDEVLQVSGFLGGLPIKYWDFGPASPVAIPLWIIARQDGSGPIEVGGKSYAPVQSNVIDAVPGDTGYSPFWQPLLVAVTEAWGGELFASIDAIDEGVRLGLLEAPRELPIAVNCPVVMPDTRLELGGGEYGAPVTCHYRGYVVYYFDLGLGAFDDEPRMKVSDLYRLRREGREPLDERARGVDMTGDGDVLDTNDVFSVGPRSASDYSGLVTPVDVVVVDTTESIDTTGDETKADITSAAGLFTGEAATPTAAVISVTRQTTVLNLPIVPSGGQP